MGKSAIAAIAVLAASFSLAACSTESKPKDDPFADAASQSDPFADDRSEDFSESALNEILGGIEDETKDPQGCVALIAELDKAYAPYNERLDSQSIYGINSATWPTELVAANITITGRLPEGATKAAWSRYVGFVQKQASLTRKYLENRSGLDITKAPDNAKDAELTAARQRILDRRTQIGSDLLVACPDMMTSHYVQRLIALDDILGQRTHQ